MSETRELRGLRAVRPTPDTLDDVILYALEAGIDVNFDRVGDPVPGVLTIALRATADTLTDGRQTVQHLRAVSVDEVRQSRAAVLRLNLIRAIMDLEDNVHAAGATIIKGDDRE